MHSHVIPLVQSLTPKLQICLFLLDIPGPHCAKVIFDCFTFIVSLSAGQGTHLEFNISLGFNNGAEFQI